MPYPDLQRRALFGATAASALLFAGGTRGVAAAPGPNPVGFAFEITRSDAEWKEMLTEAEYKILREGGTENPETSPLWQEKRAGIYCCRGCDLTLYESGWKAPVDKGWVFFYHAEPNSVLTGIDPFVEEYGQTPEGRSFVNIMEVHCRRCSSHLGHILNVEGEPLHCINGTSLVFRPDAA